MHVHPLFLLPWLIAVPAACWIPASLLLLRRLGRERQVQMLAAEAQQSQLHVELFRLGRRDTLTGLPSRPAFLDTLASRIAAGRAVTLAVIDLHRFAAVATAQGDGVGDELLCAIADRLRGLAATRDHAGRLDGDEFGLLIDDTGDIEDRRALASRLMDVLVHPYPAAGRLIDLQISMGLASAPEQARGAEALLRSAHLALRHVKQSGGHGWQICGTELDRALASRDQLRQELRRGIGRGEIIPWYQPIIDLKTGAIAKFEVLARWNHPDIGLLNAERFIPLADEMGIAGQISMALLRQVAEDCREWPETFRFSFNVSAGQVRELIGFLNCMPGEWQRRTDVTRFDIEIAESALLHDRAMARELVDTLHEHGARAGLDDFGSGTSNFAFLRDMPFDSIKIGKPFIQVMLEDPRSEACVLAMLWLGHGLGIEVVADGVETEAAAAHLAEIGCQYGQGFFYARPVPADEVPMLLRQSSKSGRQPMKERSPAAQSPALRLAG